MPKLRVLSAPERLTAPRAVLARHGWTRLEAGPPESESFELLLGELRAERSVHSWRWMAPRGGLERLLADEARLRPGVVYAYYGVRRDGSRELIAAAAVAEKVRAGFPHEGFPVVARGYVRRRYRGAGLYAPILAHRVRACRRAFGASLKAIHLGSANPLVWRAAAAGASGTRFRRIGVEALGGGPRPALVRAYAGFEPAFARRLRRECAGSRALSALIDRLLARGFGPRDYARLADAWESAGRPSPALGRLMALFAAIPLVRARPEDSR